jgi:hypothetical protein
MGKSESDDNRHLDIVSGGQYSYIDFNKASVVEDYKFRILVDVESGLVDFMWHAATASKLNVQGSLAVTGGITGNLSGTAAKATNLVVSEGSVNAERPILVTTMASSGQNTFYRSTVTLNYSKQTITAPGGFIGNASTATEAGVLRTDGTMKLYA